MPDVRTADKVAVLVSDLHLSEKAPVSRAEKGENWLKTTAWYLGGVHGLARKYKAVVVYAGDIFDKWNSSAALINFALEFLPPGYAIPGQHDLPHHNYQDVKKSAYWTLVQAGVLKDLKPDHPTKVEINDCNLYLHAFPWKHDVEPLDRDRYSKDSIHLAVIHAYIWTHAHNAYPGASTEYHINKYRKKLLGYDAALFGDNHKGFLTTYVTKRDVDKSRKVAVYNHGAFMRRKSDEKEYQPTVGLLDAHGQIETVNLVGNDKWEDNDLSHKDLMEVNQGMEQFMEFLSKVGDVALDFGEAVKRYLDDTGVSGGVRKLVMKALEE